MFKSARALRAFGGAVRVSAKAHPFPYIVVVLFIALSALGINGSSLAAFDKIVSNATPGIVAGQPRLIRSDEWNWQSQQTLIQQQAGYPEFNTNIGLGQDMSMILDVPYKSPFVVFKPQNLFFFVLPYANAFAAKWWFMALVLMLGFYFLFNKLFPNRQLIVSLGALLLLFNPFVQWWYQSMTLLAIGFALWASFFAVSIFIDKDSRGRLIGYAVGLGYFLLSFLFLLYPALQLPIAYNVVALMAGFIWYRYKKQRILPKQDTRRWLTVAAALVGAAVVCGVFYLAHSQVIHDIKNTVYPGVRDFKSGENAQPMGTGFNILETFSAPILFNLQDDQAQFYTVQSEAARIVAINLLFLPLLVWRIFKKAKKDRGLVDYLLLSTSALGVILMIRLFTPLFNPIFKLLLFNQVESQRLAFAFVLLCAMQLVLLGVFLKDMRRNTVSTKEAFITAACGFAIFLNASIAVMHMHPGFVSPLSVTIACLAIGLCAFLMLRQRAFTFGLVIFVLFNMASSIFVNPLYARTQPVGLEEATAQIAQRYHDDKKWLSLGSMFFHNVPALAGKSSFSGDQYYPQLALWRTIDPEGKEVNTYNRYAHVVFTTNIPAGENKNFYSPYNDVLEVRFNCDIAKKLTGLGYVLSSEKLNITDQFTCLQQDDTINFPGINLITYKYIGG